VFSIVPSLRNRDGVFYSSLIQEQGRLSLSSPSRSERPLPELSFGNREGGLPLSSPSGTKRAPSQLSFRNKEGSLSVLLQGRREGSSELSFRNKDGSVFPTETEGAPVHYVLIYCSRDRDYFS
jgi:hypothetical protein